MDWFRMFVDRTFVSYECSPQSHALLYTLLAVWMMVAAGGVWFYWWRFVRKAPGKIVSDC